MNELARDIHERIRSIGPIPLASFMATALYAEEHGYYWKDRMIGRDGDFFTSVSVGPLFGELLAFQFSLWMDDLCPTGTVQLVESGPHHGELARDILQWLSTHRKDLFRRVQYFLVDQSPQRRSHQEETLRPWLSRVKWTDLNDLKKIRGVIFSNELFDAFPVHSFAWNAKDRCWMERRIGSDGEKFVWITTNLEEGWEMMVPKVPPELAEVLPDGFCVEACSFADAWWGLGANALARGKLMTIDYGLTAEERLHPRYAAGTLRAFSKHHQVADVLADPGEQDITSHVDFSDLIRTGELLGLRTDPLVTQSKFLTEIMARTQKSPGLFGEWDQKRVRQFQTLTHPEHLGTRFRVLVQEKRDSIFRVPERFRYSPADS